MKIKVLKSDVGVYLSGDCHNRGFYNHRFNKTEKVLEGTFKPDWWLLRDEYEIFSVETKVTGKQINPRWELKDKEDNPISLPEVLCEEVACEEYLDDDDSWGWYISSGSKYYKYRSLYQRVTDKAEDTWGPTEFEVVDLGFLSVTDVDSFKDMKVTVKPDSNSYRSVPDRKEVDLSGIVTYSEVEQMLTPPLALHNRPCTLSSPQLYTIVRAYITDNLDGREASITSNYDFCFTVKKKLHIKPVTTKTELRKGNGRSYAKPRFNTETVSDKEYKIFEMTHSNSNYRGYTAISPLHAESLEDMVGALKYYLDTLMGVINEHLKECTHCDGYGKVAPDKLSTNPKGE